MVNHKRKILRFTNVCRIIFLELPYRYLSIDVKTHNDVVSSAGTRLQAIVTKLKLMSDFEKKQQAIEEFETVLQSLAKANKNTDRFVIGVAIVMGLLLVICAGGGCYLMLS